MTWKEGKSPQFPGFVQSLKFLKKSWNLPSNFPDLEKVWKVERMSGKMAKIVKFFFQSCNKCFISDYIFRFGQIVFALARTFAVHPEKSVVSTFLRSVLTTYLITSSLEKHYCFRKKIWKKSWIFDQKIHANPEFLMERKPDARHLEVQHFSKSSSALPFLSKWLLAPKK